MPAPRPGLPQVVEAQLLTPSQAKIAAIRDDVIEHLGGGEHVTAVMAPLVDDFAFAVVERALVAAHLAAVGPLTKAGKRRRAFDLWCKWPARVEALAVKIGLERRAVPTDSLAEAIERSSAS